MGRRGPPREGRPLPRVPARSSSPPSATRRDRQGRRSRAPGETGRSSGFCGKRREVAAGAAGRIMLCTHGRSPMGRFGKATAGIVVTLVAGCVAAGSADAQTYGQAYRGVGGYTYRQDSNYCIDIWTQRGWQRHRCMTRAEIAPIQNAQRQLEALVRQQQAAIAAQRQQEQQARAAGNNLILRRNPDGSTSMTILPPNTSNYNNSPRVGPNGSEWFQGPLQYRR